MSCGHSQLEALQILEIGGLRQEARKAEGLHFSRHDSTVTRVERDMERVHGKCERKRRKEMKKMREDIVDVGRCALPWRAEAEEEKL